RCQPPGGPGPTGAIGPPRPAGSARSTRPGRATGSPGALRRTVRTSLCPLLGIEHPIFGFSPSEHVAAAISRAGGLGVLGCVRFNDPADLDKVLDWMDQNVDGRPYGIDVVMPAKIPAEGAAIDLNKLIPAGHKEFVEQTLLKLGVPPLPDETDARDGVLGWLHSVARAQVEVALAHPARL